MAIGLGGGSLVSEDGGRVGPQSVGHNLVTEARIFGGKTLTATDIIVASGSQDIGDKSKIKDLDPRLIKTAKETMRQSLERSIEMMKPGGRNLPVILVGGGSILVDDLDLASKLYRPENAGVANAIGAAIAQVGGEAERMVSYRNQSREDALADITQSAKDKAVAAGADQATLRTVDIEETALPYMDEGAMKIRVKVIGELSL